MSAAGQQSMLRALGASDRRVLAPAGFQQKAIDRIVDRLDAPLTPTLLKAPTGAGKTLMLGQALEATAHRNSTLWFWFTPYTHLVGQTISALQAAAPKLSLYELSSERHGEHAPGDVLIANVQVVAASNQAARRVYQDDDTTVGLLTLVERARARGLRIGIVVDEAHLGLSSETVFGRVVRQIAPQHLLLASATPRDQKLNEFIDAAGYSEHLTIRINRLDAVNAGLNKRYVVAHVLAPQEGQASIADARATMLAQAWGRHLAIREELVRMGVPFAPLMLVQVENGAGKVQEAVQTLTREVGVPADRIGWHSEDAPDPLTLATIANDESREVLVFKEAAGTGFDAPRAFVLASLKRVADPNFATQFLGRIMRVDRRLREVYLREGSLPAPVDAGYLYLMNVSIQEGFEQAVLALQNFESDLGGLVEQIRRVGRRDGGTVFTNAPVDQQGFLLQQLLGAEAAGSGETGPGGGGESLAGAGAAAFPEDLFSVVETARPAGSRPEPDRPGRPAGAGAAPPPAAPASLDELTEWWRRRGVELHPLRPELGGVPAALTTESQPTLDQQEEIARGVAAELPLRAQDVEQAVATILHGLQYRDVASELTGLASGELLARIAQGGPVRGHFDRSRLARDAGDVLGELGLEDADRRAIFAGLAERLGREGASLLGGDAAASALPERSWRAVAHLLVRTRRDDVHRAYYRQLAAHVREVAAAPLPVGVLFPSQVPLPTSRRNLYGCRPPTREEWEQAELLGGEVVADLRRGKHDTHRFPDGTSVPLAYMDGAWMLNESERLFVQALDRADWIRWWHRNPDRKPFSVGVKKATQRGFFYPDFLVGVADGDDSPVRQKLLETKDDADDARLKMQRWPRFYGRVHFLKIVRDTKGFVMHLRNDDGSLREIGRDVGALREIVARE